ncbi:hypothetical protein DEU56DRAFT_755596 [Suillus clintonianus]|uniref:uncharacterized protein n=1 Tax=Suillus clintonianus TaxID=1904413 RepID=UPI001B86C459|nr:uncharacterized protein DEU56DRAFT_755596 [Suillus clintonianus]KAG2139291.1 hypothetical protein DEU56DRAFT_755596 [Suillus clintonianus]
MHGAFGDEDMVLGQISSDEESVSDFAPRSTPPDIRRLNSFPDDAPSERFWCLRHPLHQDNTHPFRHLLTTPSSFTPPGTSPLASIAPQDESSSVILNLVLTTPPRRLSSSTSILDFRTPSPPHGLSNISALPSSSEDEVETCEADVTPIRVDEGGLSNPNYTAMKTPRLPGAWAAPPVPPKHLMERSPLPTSSELTLPAMPFSRANSEPERSSKTEAPAGNGLLTPIPSLLRANSLPLRTPAPLVHHGQNGCTDQSQFGSIGTRKSILGRSALKAELHGTMRRISQPAWERCGERPYTELWPPT